MMTNGAHFALTHVSGDYASSKHAFRYVRCGLAVCAAVAFTAGCTEFDAGSDTVFMEDGLPLESDETDSELPDTVSGPGQDWSCLELENQAARQPGSVGEIVTYQLKLVDLGSGEEVEGVTARACALSDFACDDPVTDMLPPNDEGWIEFPLSENFAGYLEIISPDFVPYVFHLPDPALRDMRDFPLFMVRVESYFTILNALGVLPVPELGAIGVRAFDCQGDPAPGVGLRSNAGGVEYYFTDGLPNRESRATDADGLGGFIGSQPGVTILEATLGDGGLAAEKSIMLRAGWMTVSYLRPRAALERLQGLAQQ